jgi:hypothetical protein
VTRSVNSSVNITKAPPSVPCPTCGVAAGQRCVLHSGALRLKPLIDRKFSAIDAIKKKSRYREPTR